MDADSKKIFVYLFKEATVKCFGHSLQQPLTETESKVLYNQVLEHTGLVVGWKSLKNYSFFVLDDGGIREENPSVATLDSLARYVLNAPYTTETERKSTAGHFPYWFKYKEQHLTSNKSAAAKPELNQIKTNSKKINITVAVLVIILIVAAAFYLLHTSKTKNFTDDFHSLSADTLNRKGWFIKNEDEDFWNKRSQKPGMLSLFTLTGDNWPDSIHQPQIKNLLLRKINADCFTAEVHLQNFFPQHEWQQAGILLMEDTNYNAKSLRLSLAYNDFFGGFSRPKEVIIQAIKSTGNGLSQPEEVAHLTLFTLDSNNEKLVADNLAYSALRIEKTGNKFRLLYSGSPTKNFAFKDAAVTEFNFHPKYIGLFALQGFNKTIAAMPAYFTYFALAPQSCTKD